jgi:hypothetical protein
MTGKAAAKPLMKTWNWSLEMARASGQMSMQKKLLGSSQETSQLSLMRPYQLELLRRSFS